MGKEFTHVVVKLKVPADLRGNREAIDDWLSNLGYNFEDAEDGEVESEIVENQFSY